MAVRPGWMYERPFFQISYLNVMAHRQTELWEGTEKTLSATLCPWMYRPFQHISFYLWLCPVSSLNHVSLLYSVPEGQEWRYGDLPLVQSSEITGREFCRIGQLTPAKSGQEIWLRARVHATRLVCVLGVTGHLSLQRLERCLGFCTVAPLNCTVFSVTNHRQSPITVDRLKFLRAFGSTAD